MCSSFELANVKKVAATGFTVYCNQKLLKETGKKELRRAVSVIVLSGC
jgi:hypothetical protein